MPATDRVSPLERFQTAYRTLRPEETRQAKKDLWSACKADCMCTSEPAAGGSSQETDGGDNCPYCQSSDEGAELHTVRRLCGYQECRVCLLIDHCEEASLLQMGLSKNARLTNLLQFSQFIAHVLNSGDIDVERLKAITNALCSLLCCKSTRLRNVANTGFLTMLCPRLHCVQLQKGWGNLWSNLSKIGTAVGHHESRRSQLAALIFIRRKCILEAENSWNYYLQSEDEREERDIIEDVFNGCFEEESENTR